jgi:hypothetical protein
MSNRLPGDILTNPFTINESLTLSYNKTTIVFTAGRDILLEGNAKDAAKAILNYMLNSEEAWQNARIRGIYMDGWQQGGLQMYWGKHFDIDFEPYVASTVPDNFIKIKEEFDKLKRLLVFI